MFVIGSEERSFLDIDEQSDFPIHNLPYGVFQHNTDDEGRIGVAIGDYILDLTTVEKMGYFDDILADEVFQSSSLNNFMSQGRETWSEIRETIFNLLKDDSDLASDEDKQEKLLVSMDEVEMLLPVEVSEFTDFYSSYYHAFNVGSLIRGPENALMPNWKHLPVAYHGRASSVVVSGKKIIRPRGQIKPSDSEEPVFSETQRLDFELEMGFFVGKGNDLGNPISTSDAKDHIFGMVLVNDWSARDIQVWEYKPLGPFLGKNFATSISPWVVTLDALEPFRTEGMEQDPEPMEYLQTEEDSAYDINLEVYLQSEKMEEPKQVTWSNSTNLYWNIAQQLAHHTITGCNTQTGDLLASGTISGKEMDTRGCMLELTELGQNPIELTASEDRTFLEDGDTVTLSGYAENDNYRIGFGKVTSKILPSL